MQQNENVYGLICSVGNYQKMNETDLIAYQMDQSLLYTALVKGLKVPEDNIGMIGENGYVEIKAVARTLMGFQQMLGNEDTFLFYFSGHGSGNSLVFSDGALELRSVLSAIEHLPAKNKIVILDCCYSGSAELAQWKPEDFEQSIDTLIGHGMAVFASSAADEVSRFGPGNNHSLYTGVLTSAMMESSFEKETYR